MVTQAICMFIGTADGLLGQHVVMSVEYPGHPVVTEGVKVFEQVFVVLPDVNDHALTRNETLFAVMVNYPLASGFTKLAVLFFYRRVFPGRIFNVLSWTMIGVVCIWVVGFFFSNLSQCTPVSVNWHGSGNLPSRCIDVQIITLAGAWSDVFTDVIILLLPIPSVSPYP